MTTPVRLTDRAPLSVEERVALLCDPSVTPLPKRGNEGEVECHSRVNVCLKNKDILPPMSKDHFDNGCTRCAAESRRINC